VALEAELDDLLRCLDERMAGLSGQGRSLRLTQASGTAHPHQLEQRQRDVRDQPDHHPWGKYGLVRPPPPSSWAFGRPLEQSPSPRPPPWALHTYASDSPGCHALAAGSATVPPPPVVEVEHAPPRRALDIALAEVQRLERSGENPKRPPLTSLPANFSGKSALERLRDIATKTALRIDDTGPLIH
jgi:hypothetical protein